MDMVTKPTAGLSRQPLNDNERRALLNMMNALMSFTRLRSTMPLQYVMTFLLVAQEEGLSVVEYAERSGVSTSVMSRHLLDIGDRNRHMADGFGLVTYRANPMELRKHEYFLTSKGRALVHEIIRNMDR
jgi:DNA-binding MarR family transcriptional regulator